MIDYLRKLANRRVAAFWPPAAPFTDKDVVLTFRTREDAGAFSEALALAQTAARCRPTIEELEAILQEPDRRFVLRQTAKFMLMRLICQ